jgi:8-oxo-dGTP diphosphatase
VRKTINLTVDGVLIEGGKVLLIKRLRPPYKDCWALPGGFVEYGETVENAVVREFFEETGLKTEVLSLVGVFSDPNRDPRGHTVSVAFLLKRRGGELKGGDDAASPTFFPLPLKDLPLAFDHRKIIEEALRIKERGDPS